MTLKSELIKFLPAQKKNSVETKNDRIILCILLMSRMHNVEWGMISEFVSSHSKNSKNSNNESLLYAHTYYLYTE